MKIDRLDLDGAASPLALVTRILEVVPDLPIPVPLEQLCERFDIASIAELHTAGFEAALITDQAKALGAILVRAGVSPQRRRFSIAHELGHFLMPSHLPPLGGEFLCSSADLAALSKHEHGRHARREAEANQFAAHLLIPPPILEAKLGSHPLDLAEIGRLARTFDVSREAMARACVDQCASAAAVIMVSDGMIQRMYRREGQFPYIETGRGQPVPAGSVFHGCTLSPGLATGMASCEPGVWLAGRSLRTVASLEEQVLFQHNGYAMILLNAELRVAA
ncbi:MAG: ImmA/IrrE family metallo-endopeptidase [Pseudomonadota bacterium]